LSRAGAAFRPEVVIHQLTDLPRNLEPSQMKDAIIRNARIRREGTRNLVDAALAAGARRLIVQSIAWAYAPGREPHVESDPLDVEAAGDRAVSVNGVIALEGLALQSPPLEGIVLRYGHLYGPGAHSETAADSPAVHADAAAYAALLAVDHGEPGAFNIAEENPHVATDKALLNLGWNAEFRLSTLPEQHRNRM
jgi:nucleoside-diphosphate-sugar epimerase